MQLARLLELVDGFREPATKACNIVLEIKRDGPTREGLSRLLQAADEVAKAASKLNEVVPVKKEL